MKRFYTPQDRYPGSDLFARIGTGFNGTVAGQNYGIVTETPIQSISATFHSDGFIYAEHQTARSVLRISPVTGRIDTVEVPGRLLDLFRGLPFDAHALITSDGEFIYNVSAGVMVRGAAGGVCGYLIRPMPGVSCDNLPYHPQKRDLAICTQMARLPMDGLST